MAIILKRKEPVPAPVVIAPKVTIRVGPKPLPLPIKAKPVEEPMTERQQQKLIDSGLMEPEEKKWEQCPIGSRVRITNTMFPWVKHYKPGDIGVVRSVSQANSCTDDKTGGHLSHVLNITEPLDASRKGQTAMLFRWEFEPVKVSV
jgi:hypothetical protein